MKDNKNFKPSRYIQPIDCSLTINNNIVLNDNIEQLHIQYKDKEYVFNLEKALSLLCKEIKK